MAHLMIYKLEEMRLLATPEKGEVSALMIGPNESSHLLVLRHGASTNMRHPHVGDMADAGKAARVVRQWASGLK